MVVGGVGLGEVRGREGVHCAVLRHANKCSVWRSLPGLHWPSAPYSVPSAPAPTSTQHHSDTPPPTLAPDQDHPIHLQAPPSPPPNAGMLWRVTASCIQRYCPPQPHTVVFEIVVESTSRRSPTLNIGMMVRKWIEKRVPCTLSSRPSISLAVACSRHAEPCVVMMCSCVGEQRGVAKQCASVGLKQ